jgi:hypothetical protein
MEKEGLERRYSVFAAVLILIVYASAYLVKPAQTPVYPTMIAVGFVVFFIVFFLFLVYLFENLSSRKLDYLNTILNFSFVNLLGESIALIFSFFFYITLVSAFDLVVGSLVVIQPASFLILASFNHLHYKNRKAISIFAVTGTVFLLIGFLSQYSSLFLISTAVALMLFSAVSYRVFKIEIPEEIERYQG